MTRVLYVHFGEQWIRGSEQVLLDLVSRAAANGIEPVVWTNVAALADAVRALGVPAESDSFTIYFSYGSSRFSPRAFAGTVSRGTAIVRRYRPHVIHCNSAGPLQWCLPVGWRTGLPVLVHLHTEYLRRSRLVMGVPLADRVVGVSGPTLVPCRRDGIEEARLQVIHNGIDPHRLTGQDQVDTRRLVGAGPGGFVAAIVASLIHRKGHDVLFAAFDRLAARFPELHLAVIGSGPEEAAIRAMARSPRIHFLGERTDVGALLAGGIDVLVLPSRQEAAGLVIAEAGFFGVPSIGSDVGGIPEMMRDGETGLLVPPDSPEALADALARLIEDSVLRARLGAEAEALFHRQFHVDRMAATFAAAYRELADRGPGGWRAAPARLWRARAAWSRRAAPA